MNRLRKILTSVTATTVVVANVAAVDVLFGTHAYAARTNGTAPYINQWAVSGPYTNPVVDNIYNLVPSTSAEMDSPPFNQTQKIWAYIAGNPDPTVKSGSSKGLSVDGDLNTSWQSTLSGSENSGNGGTRQSKVVLEYPGNVTSIRLNGFYTSSATSSTDPCTVKYEVFNTSGAKLTEGTISNVTNDMNDMKEINFSKVQPNVAYVLFTIDATKATNGSSRTGTNYGMREVSVYALPPTPPDLSSNNVSYLTGVTASSSTTIGTNGAAHVLDGDTGTYWQSQTPLGADTTGWDSNPTLTLTLPQPEIITSIPFVGYESSGTYKFAVNYKLYDAANNVLASGTKYDVTGSTTDNQTIDLYYGLTNVSKVTLSIDPNNGGNSTLDPTKNGLFGFRNAQLKGTPTLEGVAPITGFTGIMASSTYQSNVAANAFDGNTATAWKSNDKQGVSWPDDNPYIMAALPQASMVNSITFNMTEASATKPFHVSYQLFDSNNRVLYFGDTTATGADANHTVDLGVGVNNVSKIMMAINTAPATNTNELFGFREISFTGKAMPDQTQKPLGNIVPVIGESLVDPKSTETSTWQYFDDRIFNRNYDDYNDLMGYFDVKQGQATTDKWVVAGTYVYSPTAQTVQWQLGGSGLYKLFANDIGNGQQDEIASRVSKNGTSYSVKLKQGWNKLLIEMQHKNTGTNKNFLGFYTRLCDSDGNAIPGLTYSVTGPNVSNNQLTIVTQGLTIDKNAFDARNANVPANDYPSNTLPYAYAENPYVWMVAKIDGNLNTSGIAPQAAPFAFQSAGGNPGYTWEIADGQLPPGLTLASDGHIDGTVSAGANGTSQKDYTFTVKVKDALGFTATKPYTITVKENPVDWFIQGKMSALSHTTGTMPNLYDPNFNYDEWAHTAKEMGMTLLSTESLQNTIYYWPSPNANLTPSDSNKMYKYNALYQSEDGAWHVKDRVMQAKQAAERYGLKFGVYVSSLYEGKEILESDIQGLVERYNPWYLFADGGPEGYSNVDVAWSSARNYNDRVLIDANPNAQTGDQDITLHERPFWHSEPYNDGFWRNGVLPQTRKVAHEEWNDPYTTALDVWTIYAGGNERDSWPEATKELINQYGHGYVMNYDSSITVTRGMDNLSSNLDNNNIFSMVPISSQQLSDMRTSIVKWMVNAGGPDLRESLYGTMPYTMDYTIKSGWYTDPQKAIAHGQGPDWGYAMNRDQYVYMHMIKNLISGVSKTGFTGQASMSGIGPFHYPVDKVEWLNKGVSLPFTAQQNNDKYYITIDTSSVVADPIDTILKITTQDATRKYTISSVKLFSSQTSTNQLQLRAESYMNNFTNVFAPATLNYTSDNTSVATVNPATGLVTAVGDGTATITVTATYNDGVNAPQVKTDTYPVKVSGGAIATTLPLVGVNMFTNGNLFWGQFSTNKDLPVTFQGFTQKGGAVDILNGTNITYHYAKVDGNRNNSAGKIIVTEVPSDQVPFTVNGNTMKFKNNVADSTMYCYWADITVDGKTYTSTRNYITLIPDANVAAGITPTVTSDSSNAGKLSDGTINDSTGGNLTKWTAAASDANPSITYDLGKQQSLTRVNIFFNNHMPNADNVTYYNVPNKVKIEYSVDGTNWMAGNETNTLSGGGLPTSRNTLAVPKSDTTLYGWEQEGLYYNYPVDPSKSSVQARYVRISFPGGGQGGSPIDILEAQVFSSDVTTVATLNKIVAPAAITGLPNGTAKTAAALGLPSTVTLVTYTGNVNANVTWNVDAASYDPAVKTEQTFTVNGTVALPAGVVNPNNVALTPSISVTVLAASILPQSTLASSQQVTQGQTFDVKIGLTGVTQSVYQQVYAQDLTLHYNPMNLQLDSVTSLKDGLQVIDQKEAVPGHVRILVASVGANQGVLAQGDLLAIKFTVKPVTQATSTTISVGNVTIANGQGNELHVSGASREIQISIPSIPVDKSLLNALIASAQVKYNAAVEGNGDGLYAIGSKAQLQSAIDTASATANNPNAAQQQVDSAKAALEDAIQVFNSKKITADVDGDGSISIGDLAIVAGGYGKQQGQAGWNEKADINKDGKVDIVDLAIVAKAILK
ncbi:hypothetical protein Elgi_32150 [Paenibacillus elgii]|uniref:galactose-binding domain-containing protein n=1 Tax=Paenibacillus elgii TaxID=189691 RepID=UPI002D7B2716|nr:hypothetical protein Elgi_32150 [Paenibacillus elgii]